jgi:predicted  nucleic acid-binding Zn-ribbon protein
MKGIVSGTVSVKETDKSVAQITHLISLLDDFIAKKAGIKSQLQSLQEKLGIFDSKQLDDLEKQLMRAKTDKEDSESKIKKLQEELGQDRTQRQTLMGDLQGALERISGAKYTIQF